jgi:general stress protein 26
MASKLNRTEDPKAHLVRLVKDFDNAMLITKNASDQLRGRPMRIAKADVEQNLWFITSMDSAKIEELMRDPRACITMQKNGEYISLSGNVHVSNDKGGIEEIWKESYRPWFPEGKDTPDLVLLKVDTTWGEYWDTASGEKTTMDFLKKMVGSGGKKSTLPEDHAKVTLTAPTQM